MVATISASGSVCVRRVVERAGLEARPFRQVEELEVRPVERRDIGLDRLPHRVVLGVVVDDEDFVARIVQLLERADGLDHHLRRLVVAGDVDRNLGQLPGAAHRRRDAPAAALAQPQIDRHLHAFDQEDREQQDGRRRDHRQRDDVEPGEIAPAIGGIDPDRDHHAALPQQRQEEAAASDQAQFRAHHPQHERQAEHQHGGGQPAPVLVIDQDALQGRLQVAVAVPHAPIGADAAFELGLPRLVEAFDDEILDVLLLGLAHEVAQEDALVDRRGDRALALQSLARPADLGQHHALVEAALLQRFLDRLVVAHGPGHGVLDRDAVPERQDVDGDIVDLVQQLGMVQPHAIGLRGADRDAGQAALHFADVVDELGNLDQVLVDRLVADGDPVDAAVVGGERDQVVDLLLVPLRIDVDPGARHHAQAHLVGHGRHAEIGADGRIGADLAGQARHQRQVAADLRQGRLLAIGRIGVVPERGVGEAGDVLGPGVLLDRPIQQHPGAGKQHRHDQADHPVRETHVFRFRDARCQRL